MKKREWLGFWAFTGLILLSAVVVSLVLHTDRLYTHFFYIPIAVSAVKYPRITFGLGVCFALFHLGVEWLFRSSLEWTVFLRSAILLLVSGALNVIWKREHDYRAKIDRLDYQRYHDGLTGVFNRRHFDDLQLQQMSYPVALLVCDVDGLKKINDTHGHLIGDGYILGLTQVLEKSLRDQDQVIRLGGDEFLVVLEATTPSTLGAVLKRIEEEISKHHKAMDTSELFPLPLSFSVGHAIAESPKDFHEALQEADRDMYVKKAEKKREVR